MRPVPRAILAIMVGRAVFGMLFLVSVVAHWPMPWYLPLEHRWVFATSVRTVGMDWYGRSGVALVGGALACGAAWAIAGVRRLSPWLGRPAVVVGIAHLGAAMLFFDVMFYTLTLLTRDIDPIPRPPWYCPR